MMRVRRDGMRLTTATGNTPEIVTQIQKVKRGAVEKRGGDCSHQIIGRQMKLLQSEERIAPARL